MKYLLLFFALFAPLLGEEVITPELITLLDHFQLKHDGTLPSINEAVQKAWLRPPKTERWQTPDIYNAQDRDAVFDYYKKTGKFDERKPGKASYQNGVICGATTSRMKKRLGYFEKQDLQVGKVVLLAGARPLDSEVEVIPDGCATEGDALMEHWRASPLFEVTSWRYFQHPMITLADGSIRRPGAYDIFVLLLKEEQEGDLLLVVNQPYCCYFEAVAKWVFPEGYTFEVVGEAANPDSQKTNDLLDNLARWIYSEFKALQKCEG
jgi:hypothetical protein